MVQKVKNLFNTAKSDLDFQSELKIHEPEFFKPSIFWSENEKILYSLIYMGWLIGKCIYNENDYS